MGTLIQKDAKLFRGWFKEMAKLIGIRVLYQYMHTDKSFDVHGALKGTYSDPENLDIIFIEYPDQKTLKKLGWYSEDKEQRPIMAQLPYDTPNLQSGCRILIPYGVTEVDYKTFRITEIKTIPTMPDSYYVKLAPEFASIFSETLSDYSDSDFNMISGEDGTV